jgi:phenylacetate-CoA oxygenase PaaJ subunit
MTTSPTLEQVWEVLGTVQDPEFPLSLVDLGMIYDVRIHGSAVEIDMTFTSIGCPAIDFLTSDVRAAVGTLPGVESVEVTVVWDPPWAKNRITDSGRRVLAAYGVV